jgi:hypothetical protein
MLESFFFSDYYYSHASFPLIMNIMQFWITDTFLKMGPKADKPRDQPTEDERAPLLPK